MSFELRNSVTGEPGYLEEINHAMIVSLGSGAATILQTTTVAAIGTSVSATGGRLSCQAVATGDGTLTATVLIQVSNNNVDFLTLGTITLSGTTPQQDGFATDVPWAYIRSNVTVFSQSSGTNKSITITLGG